jgi:hypothetical protein
MLKVPCAKTKAAHFRLLPLRLLPLRLMLRLPFLWMGVFRAKPMGLQSNAK